jgi:sensor histidine kinase YesM
MPKKRIISIHFFLWLFAIFANLPYTDFSRFSDPRTLTSNIIGFLYLAVVFYLFYFVIVPRFLEKRGIRIFFIVAFFTVLVMPFFGYTILFFSRALFDNSFHHFYRGYSLKTHMSGYFPVLSAAVFGSFFRMIISWFTTMSQKAELNRQKLAMELELIRNKMNPHFLFNTLNNIDSLIQTDQSEASAMLIRLSEIMRYMTYDADSDFVELGRECDYLRNLVELHRMRLNDPDEIVLDISGSMSCRIAPALFSPLVENAFKFASFRGRKPSVEIHLAASDGIISFRSSNNFDSSYFKKDAERSGSGIVNLKRRLDLTYPDHYSLLIENNEPRYSVVLTIDTNGNTMYSS